MEERMTVCNMSIEGGARAGMVAADQKTVEYLRGRQYIPTGAEFDELARALAHIPQRRGREVRPQHRVRRGDFAPQVTWGTNPGMVTEVTGKVPDPPSYPDANQRRAVELALEYMGLQPGTRIEDIKVDRVFIGSCTNSRI